ncbi:arylamine N-acetyltransferase [Sphingobium sp. EM0848]|uniref:arylamine N-acetyltransferase family protein n=1 Tax=Sphingobium sp. EM0848 TaxID=2743473 RepID=UPI00159C79DF|nr:arylamine N-acetyltransferase [Sphingobium sp. EM0848]
MAESLTEAQLDAYLARIGVRRPERTDPAALKAIHRAHAYGFTWEAIDCFMEWPTSVDPQDAFAKMVEHRRGGWCYEMNGLLGAALSACGFAVTRLCGGVRRAELGDLAIGNHLTLRVDFEEPWLAEVGLGDALVDPIPLVVGSAEQRGYAFALEHADGDWLRFRNHAYSGAPSFDFRADYVDEPALGHAQRYLREAEASPFRTNLVIQRHFPDRIEAVRNATRYTTTPRGVSERPIRDAEEFTALLDGVFQIVVPCPEAVWDRVCQVIDLSPN